jgi:hypothetical protein
MTEQWMFLALIEKPYHYENLMDIPGAQAENGVPLYLDGYAYNGVVNLQNRVQKWPATAGIGYDEISALDALKAQSAPANYIPDEDAMKLERIKNDKKIRNKD